MTTQPPKSRKNPTTKTERRTKAIEKIRGEISGLRALLASDAMSYPLNAHTNTEARKHAEMADFYLIEAGDVLARAAHNLYQLQDELEATNAE